MSGLDHDAVPRRPAPGTEVAARSRHADSDNGPHRGVVLPLDDLAALEHTPTANRGALQAMTPVRWDGEEIRWERTADLQPYTGALAEWERANGDLDSRTERTAGMAGLAARLPGGLPTQERPR